MRVAFPRLSLSFDVVSRPDPLCFIYSADISLSRCDFTLLSHLAAQRTASYLCISKAKGGGFLHLVPRPLRLRLCPSSVNRQELAGTAGSIHPLRGQVRILCLRHCRPEQSCVLARKIAEHSRIPARKQASHRATFGACYKRSSRHGSGSRSLLHQRAEASVAVAKSKTGPSGTTGGRSFASASRLRPFFGCFEWIVEACYLRASKRSIASLRGCVKHSKQGSSNRYSPNETAPPSAAKRTHFVHSVRLSSSIASGSHREAAVPRSWGRLRRLACHSSRISPSHPAPSRSGHFLRCPALSHENLCRPINFVPTLLISNSIFHEAALISHLTSGRETAGTILLP